ncbi:MAG: NuoM family protein [Thermoplasmata archaeon]|nr:NuoM family protein [Thermoplasmata archaeon]
MFEDILQGVPVLSLLILLPLIGAILVFAFGKSLKIVRIISLIFSGIPVALVVMIFFAFQWGGALPDGETFADPQFYESYSWIPSLGVSYTVGIDGISLPLLLITPLLTFLSILFSWDVKTRPKEYFGLILIMQVGITGVFVLLDYFVFYIFWEIVLIPMYFLIGIWGGPNKDYAAIKFFIYTHVASLVMLLAIMALYFQAGATSFDMIELGHVAPGFSTAFQVIAFGAFLFGFGVKMPMVPFHTWLPDAHVEAPTAGSVLLAGLLLKMGGYGLIRVAIPTLPQGATTLAPLMAVIGIVSILYAAVVCLAQKDLKKMVAYSSVSHMGFVMVGFATLGSVGIVAGVFQMFAHGLVTAVLFMSCGVVQHHCGTRIIQELGGISKMMPVLTALMTAGFLASLGLPGLVSFAAEFLIFYSIFVTYGLWLFLPILSVAITAGYYLWALQRSMFGPLNNKIDAPKIHDANWYESVPMGILIALIALFGILPAIILSRIGDAVDIVLRGLGVG